jgi:hypothetical protein
MPLAVWRSACHSSRAMHTQPLLTLQAHWEALQQPASPILLLAHCQHYELVPAASRPSTITQSFHPTPATPITQCCCALTSPLVF